VGNNKRSRRRLLTRFIWRIAASVLPDADIPSLTADTSQVPETYFHLLLAKILNENNSLFNKFI
jgi:hypothetical protein